MTRRPYEDLVAEFPGLKVEDGKRHYKLFLGNTLVGVIGRVATANWRNQRNLRAHIRRIQRGAADVQP